MTTSLFLAITFFLLPLAATLLNFNPGSSPETCPDGTTPIPDRMTGTSAVAHSPFYYYPSIRAYSYNEAGDICEGAVVEGTRLMKVDDSAKYAILMDFVKGNLNITLACSIVSVYQTI